MRGEAVENIYEGNLGGKEREEKEWPKEWKIKKKPKSFVSVPYSCYSCK